MPVLKESEDMLSTWSACLIMESDSSLHMIDQLHSASISSMVLESVNEM